MRIFTVIFLLFMAVKSMGQTSPASFETVASMTNTVPQVITSAGKGSLDLRGYYAAGDGGGGMFYYDSTSSAEVDNGFVFAPVAGSGRYIRTDQTIANVRFFGARGDGVTDDAPAIQRAIDTSQPQPTIPAGKRVYVPGGSYALGKKINIPTGCRFYGDNSQYTTLLFGIPGTVFEDEVIVDVKDDSGGVGFQVNQGVIIEDMDIRGSEDVNAHAMRIQRLYDNVELNRLTIKNVSRNYHALWVTTNLSGVGQLGQGLKATSCYFARNLLKGSQVPLVNLHRLYESQFTGCKFFAEPGSTPPATAEEISKVVIRVHDCRGLSFFGGGIAEGLVGIEIVSTVAPCVGITVDDSVTFESIYKFVTVNGTGITQGLNMGNFRYQFGNNPDMVLEATNLTHSIVHDNVGFGVSIQGTSSVRNWIYAGPIFSGLAADYAASGGTNRNVQLQNTTQNSVFYNATAAGQITTVGQSMAINSDNTPLLLFTVTGQTNNARISYGAATNGADNGISFRTGSGQVMATIDNTRLAIQNQLRITHTNNPFIEFRMSSNDTNYTAPTNAPSLIWLATSNTLPGELQLRLNVNTAGLSIFSPDNLELIGGVITNVSSTNLAGITNNTFIKIRTTSPSLSTAEPVIWDPDTGVLYLRSLNLPSGGGAGATNGTAVFADGVGPQLSINLTDSTGIIGTLAGSNWTHRLQDRDWGSISSSGSGLTLTIDDGAVSTNMINSTFRTWVESMAAGGGATDLEALTDVDLGTPASSQVLTYNGTVWTNAAAPAGGGGGGSGTNIFVGANTLVQPAHLTGSANATWSVENSTNVVVTFTGVGSATNGYLVKSVTAVTNIGGAGELPHMNVTIPGDTLSEDGDELVFTIPGYYGNYLNAADEHLTWRFDWTDAPQTLASYSLTNTVANTSTERAVVWEVRLKRLSATRFLAWTEWKIGFGAASEAQNPIESFRVSGLTVDMGLFDFSDDLTFELAAEHSANSISADTLVTYGYTVLKPGSAGGSGSESSTRTGVARTMNWPANTFTPEFTDPATAYTNIWATATDRYAQECWQFSATTTNGIRADFIWPNTYSNATPVNVRFWVKQLAAEATSTNAFSISVGSQGSGDTGGALLGTAVVVNVVGANNTNQLTQSSWTSAITAGNTPSAGDKGIISIRRHPGNTSDNGSVAVVITDIEMEYLEHNVEPSNN